jgi:hypothetical protein
MKKNIMKYFSVWIVVKKAWNNSIFDINMLAVGLGSQQNKILVNEKKALNRKKNLKIIKLDKWLWQTRRGWELFEKRWKKANRSLAVANTQTLFFALFYMKK